MYYQMENQGSSGEDNIETKKPENFNDLLECIRTAKRKRIFNFFMIYDLLVIYVLYLN